MAAAQDRTRDMQNHLAELMQDANGSDTYSATKAIFAHLPANEHFVLTTEMKDELNAHNAWDCDLLEFGKKDGVNRYINMTQAEAGAISGYRCNVNNFAYSKMLAINYHKLMLAGKPSPDAFVIAALRCRWFVLGCLKPAINSARELSLEHYEYVVGDPKSDPLCDMIMQANTIEELLDSFADNGAEFLSAISSNQHGSKWVTRHAENLWAAVECVMRTRSHHMKTTGREAASYEDLYNRIMTAAYEGNFELPAATSWLSIARTAIHCFLIESLPIMTSKFIAYNKVAASTVMRLSGGPCGCAQVTTAAAALDTMSVEVWFETFKKAYGSDVSIALAAKDIILNDKYSYHIAAPLYGLAKKTSITIEATTYQVGEIVSKIQNVAAACQGLINAMAEARVDGLISNFALANARALEKSAASAPLLAMRVKLVVQKSIDAIDDASSVAQAIEAAFPGVASGI